MFLRFFKWVANRFRPAIGWLAFLVALGTVSIAAWGLMEARWMEGDELFARVALLGALGGAILAHTRGTARWSGLLLGIVGVLYVSNTLSQFLPPFLKGFGELWQGLVWLWTRTRYPGQIFATPTFTQWEESASRLMVLGQRLASWGSGLFQGEVQENPTAFLFISGLLLWASAAWLMWAIIRRGNPLQAVLPLSSVFGLSAYLSNTQSGFVLGFAACVAVLFPVTRLNYQEQEWERKAIEYSTEIRFDVWQIGIVFTLIVVALSILTPVIYVPRLLNNIWQVLSNPQQAFEEVMTRLFGGVEPGEAEIPAGAWRVGQGGGGTALPRSHLLGGTPNLSQQKVMAVCIDAAPPTREGPFQFWVGPRYYWRGATYDRFDGYRWFNSPSFTENLAPYEAIAPAAHAATKELAQRYLIETPHGSTLYAAQEPVFVDQSSRIRRRDIGDLVGLEGTSQDYVVTSRVSVATTEQLIATPAEYPEYIAQNYTVLRKDTSQRIRALANEITARSTTAYEKATAIEKYLRQFPYDLQVGYPPEEQDIVEYFLFDLQRGYCDYYASAFVILARAAGLPARLAIGYGMGTYDPASNCYQVTEINAHSWPEVYFSGYGWIPFEPTASFSRLERPQEMATRTTPISQVPDLPRRPWYVLVREWWREIQFQWTTYLWLGSILILLVGLGLFGRWRRRRARLSPAHGVALCFERMCHIGKRVGIAHQPQDTPAEYGERMVGALFDRVARWPWPDEQTSELAMRSAERVGDICWTYQEASYSAVPITQNERHQTEQQLRQLRWQLTWLRLISRRGG